MHPLSPRQREILLLFASGLTAKEIAAKLGRSEHTVRGHVEVTLDRLKARTLAHAVFIFVSSRGNPARW